MEALSKKGTPASARTGTGAGTARLAPPCTATESSLHLSAPYQCQLIRGQPFMADYRPAAAGRGVPATPRRHSVSCGTPFDSLRRAGRRSGRGQPCSLLISGFSLPGNALPCRATCIRNCSHSWATGRPICAGFSCADTAPKFTSGTTVPPRASHPPRAAPGRWGSYRAMPCCLLSQAEGFTTLVPALVGPVTQGDTRPTGIKRGGSMMTRLESNRAMPTADENRRMRRRAQFRRARFSRRQSVVR